MGMSIDEIIAKETEIAQEFQKVIDTQMVSETMSLEEMYCDDTEVIEEHLQRCKVFADYHNQIAETMRKYQKLVDENKLLRADITMMQADYNARLKADMVAMLTEIQLEIEGQCKKENNNIRVYDYNNGISACYKVVQQKIEQLKGGADA